jgi:hypothetical protein
MGHPADAARESQWQFMKTLDPRIWASGQLPREVISIISQPEATPEEKEPTSEEEGKRIYYFVFRPGASADEIYQIMKDAEDKYLPGPPDYAKPVRQREK